jgi:hypothetical protein
VKSFPSPFDVPAFASRVILFPPRDSASLTVGLPAKQPDPDGVSTFHMHETRTEWAPSVPRGQWCSTRPRHAPQPASAASQRPVPDLGRVLHPFHPTFKMTRHQPRVHSRSPARPSPRPWPPEGTRTLRLEPWAPHPAVTRDARQGGDRPPSTSRGSRHHNRNLLHRDPLTTCDLVSHAQGLAVHREHPASPGRRRLRAQLLHGRSDDRVEQPADGRLRRAARVHAESGGHRDR